MSEPSTAPDSVELDSISELFGGAARFALDRAKGGLERTAKEGRHRLEQRQRQRDLDAMWKKLGREVCALVEAGEVDHPGLVRGADRIRALEEERKGKGE